MRPRLFRGSFDRGERLAYGVVAALFVAAFFAFLWPIYPLFARVRPMVLGVPASLAYIVTWLLVCFVALLALYAWESASGRIDRQETELDEAARAAGAAREPRFHPAPAEAPGAEKG